MSSGMNKNPKQSAPRKARFKAGIPAVVHYRGRDYPCRAFDLSRSGVLLQGGIPWPADDQIDFRLDTPVGDRQLELVGRVVRIHEIEGDEETAIALEFKPQGAGEERLLESILQRVIEGHSPVLLGEINPGDTVEQIRKKLEQIPVAHRVGLATRSSIPHEREILRGDPDPGVLDALSRNPNVLEVEIRLLLKNKLLLPRTLAQIAADSRWLRNYDLLALAIAHHRATLPMAEKHLGRMPPPELQKLMRKPGVSPALLAELRRRTSG